MKQPPKYTMKQAAELGYVAITIPFADESERDQKFLKNVLRDMQGVDHCLIEVWRGVEVGRLKSELL